MEKINSDVKTLKNFGITMAAALFIIALLMFYKNGGFPVILAVFSGVFLIFAFIVPQSLKAIFMIWMKLAGILSWVNTRLILIILFYLVLTPVSLLMRLFNQDPLGLKINSNETSYWKEKKRGASSKSDYERQF